MTNKPLYLYLDLETPGLIPELGILELAWFVTEDLFEAGRVLSGLNRDVDRLMAYDQAIDYVKDMHSKSSLWDALADDTKTEQLFEIEGAILDDIDDWEGPVYLVGNSIRLDRAFIERWMPRLSAKLHYRQIDLTSVRLFLEGRGIDTTREDWTGDVAHRAEQDILDSLEFAKHLAQFVRPEHDETFEAVFLDGPLEGRKLRVPKGTKNLKLDAVLYSEVKDPDTGLGLGGFYVSKARP